MPDLSHPRPDPSAPAADASPLLGALRDALRQRLRDVCGGIPPADFEALTDRMARLQYKYEMRREHEGGS